jgi:phage shock protein E
MKRILCAALIILAVLAGFAPLSFGGDGVRPLIIDVRTEAEWHQGHLEGAVLIPYDQIGRKIVTVAPEKSQRIYLYCRTGRRTGVAGQTLAKLGYRNVVDLGPMENAARVLKRKIIK